jgi:hypothetical protein
MDGDEGRNRDSEGDARCLQTDIEEAGPKVERRGRRGRAGPLTKPCFHKSNHPHRSISAANGLNLSKQFGTAKPVDRRTGEHQDKHDLGNTAMTTHTMTANSIRSFRSTPMPEPQLNLTGSIDLNRASSRAADSRLGVG